jgi:hypothetical protein
MSPNEIMRFIEKNNLGYILGNAVRSILLSITDIELDEDRTKLYPRNKLQHLKDARQFLNVEIKRLSKGGK